MIPPPEPLASIQKNSRSFLLRDFLAGAVLTLIQNLHDPVTVFLTLLVHGGQVYF